jgi:hypothetical protein
MPQRIQLRRTKGWRKPEGAVVVSRPSKWGNPFRVEQVDPLHVSEYGGRWFVDDGVGCEFFQARDDAESHAVDCFQSDILGNRAAITVEEIRSELAGRDLACWCSLLARRCHANVLLEIANEVVS